MPPKTSLLKAIGLEIPSATELKRQHLELLSYCELKAQEHQITFDHDQAELMKTSEIYCNALKEDDFHGAMRLIDFHLYEIKIHVEAEILRKKHRQEQEADRAELLKKEKARMDEHQRMVKERDKEKAIIAKKKLLEEATRQEAEKLKKAQEDAVRNAKKLERELKDRERQEQLKQLEKEEKEEEQRKEQEKEVERQKEKQRRIDLGIAQEKHHEAWRAKATQEKLESKKREEALYEQQQLKYQADMNEQWAVQEKAEEQEQQKDPKRHKLAMEQISNEQDQRERLRIEKDKEQQEEAEKKQRAQRDQERKALDLQLMELGKGSEKDTELREKQRKDWEMEENRRMKEKMKEEREELSKSPQKKMEFLDRLFKLASEARNGGLTLDGALDERVKSIENSCNNQQQVDLDTVEPELLSLKDDLETELRSRERLKGHVKKRYNDIREAIANVDPKIKLEMADRMNQVKEAIDTENCTLQTLKQAAKTLVELIKLPDGTQVLNQAIDKPKASIEDWMSLYEEVHNVRYQEAKQFLDDSEIEDDARQLVKDKYDKYKRFADQWSTYELFLPHRDEAMSYLRNLSEAIDVLDHQVKNRTKFNDFVVKTDMKDQQFKAQTASTRYANQPRMSKSHSAMKEIDRKLRSLMDVHDWFGASIIAPKVLKAYEEIIVIGNAIGEEHRKYELLLVEVFSKYAVMNDPRVEKINPQVKKAAEDAFAVSKTHENPPVDWEKSVKDLNKLSAAIDNLDSEVKKYAEFLGLVASTGMAEKKLAAQTANKRFANQPRMSKSYSAMDEIQRKFSSFHDVYDWARALEIMPSVLKAYDEIIVIGNAMGEEHEKYQSLASEVIQKYVLTEENGRLENINPKVREAATKAYNPVEKTYEEMKYLNNCPIDLEKSIEELNKLSAAIDDLDFEVQKRNECIRLSHVLKAKQNEADQFYGRHYSLLGKSKSYLATRERQEKLHEVIEVFDWAEAAKLIPSITEAYGEVIVSGNEYVARFTALSEKPITEAVVICKNPPGPLEWNEVKDFNDAHNLFLDSQSSGEVKVETVDKLIHAIDKLIEANSKWKNDRIVFENKMAKIDGYEAAKKLAMTRSREVNDKIAAFISADRYVTTLSVQQEWEQAAKAVDAQNLEKATKELIETYNNIHNNPGYKKKSDNKLHDLMKKATTACDISHSHSKFTVRLKDDVETQLKNIKNFLWEKNNFLQFEEGAEKLSKALDELNTAKKEFHEFARKLTEFKERTEIRPKRVLPRGALGRETEAFQAKRDSTMESAKDLAGEGHITKANELLVNFLPALDALWKAIEEYKSK